MINIGELQELCHQRARDAGWWGFGMDREYVPNVGEKICLIHSEVSEAMEGYHENLMDDKLPHRNMFEVEIADAWIRVLDLAGYLKLKLHDVVGSISDTSLEPKLCGGIERVFNDLNKHISEAMEGHRKGLTTKELGKEFSVMEVEFSKFLLLSKRMMESFDFDLEGAIHEKMEYNLHRDDHKLENRKKDGGKNY